MLFVAAATFKQLQLKVQCFFHSAQNFKLYLTNIVQTKSFMYMLNCHSILAVVIFRRYTVPRC